MTGGGRAGATARVGLLFTRYPVLTERFLHREVKTLRQLGLAFAITPLWPGRDAIEDALPVHEPFRPSELWTLFFWLPYWALRRPRALTRMATALIGPAPRSWINLWENLLGMGFGLVRARRLARQFEQLHAVWASAPATAAWTVWLLTDMPYSLAGHAYDLFERGGDWLLADKMPAAQFIRTSTEAGRARWVQLGADPAKLKVIRRGVEVAQPWDQSDDARTARVDGRIHLLAVGRLVPKMGYPYTLEICWHLKRQQIDFTCEIIGAGPMRGQIMRAVARFGLEDYVILRGALPHHEVDAAYVRADALLFTGEVDAKGDRAGFPNAVGEAMIAGLPVCCRPVGAVREAIEDLRTGLILTDPVTDAQRIVAMLQCAKLRQRLRSEARQWAVENFSVQANMRELMRLFEQVGK